MDQASSLSDTSATKALSALGGLLSQISGAFGDDSAEGSLFSNLLSQSDAVQAALTAQTQAQTQTPVTATAASTTTASAATSSAAGSADTSTEATGASGDAIQNLSEIASVLRKVLMALRQKNAAANSGTHGNAHDKKTQTASSASDASSATPSAPTTANAAPATTGAAKTDTTATVGNNDTPATTDGKDTSGQSSTTTAIASTAAALADSATTAVATDTQDADASTQSISDIVAELLAITQMMIKNLQQQQLTGGGAADKKTAELDALEKLDTASGTGKTTDPDDLLATLLTANAGGKQDDAILSLLKGLEKDVRQLLPLDKNAAQAKGDTTPSTATATATPAAAPTTAADLFATIDTGIKQVISTLQQQSQTTATEKNTAAVIKTVATDATVTAAEDIAAKPATPNDMIGKTASSDPTRTQSLAASLTTAPAPPAPMTEQTPVATAAAALAVQTAAKENNGAGSGTDADLLSGGGHSAATPADLGSGLTAGTQAPGPYSFASTLSALRATSGGATGLPSVVDQVILQMNRSVKNGNDQMSLQLHPADLGKITVKLDFTSDGKVQGTVVADNPKTLDMLQKDSRSLERALQDAGLRADPGSLQFSLGGQDQQPNAGQSANNNNKNSGSGGTDGTISADDMTGLVDIGAMSETYYVTPGGVNIRV